MCSSDLLGAVFDSGLKLDIDFFRKDGLGSNLLFAVQNAARCVSDIGLWNRKARIPQLWTYSQDLLVNALLCVDASRGSLWAHLLSLASMLIHDATLFDDPDLIWPGESNRTRQIEPDFEVLFASMNYPFPANPPTLAKSIESAILNIEPENNRLILNQAN